MKNHRIATTRLPIHLCPWCGKTLSAVSGPAGGPSEGDFSVCIRCAGILVFHGGVFQKPDDAELESMHPENLDAIRHAQELVKTIARHPSETVTPIGLAKKIAKAGKLR